MVLMYPHKREREEGSIFFVSRKASSMSGSRVNSRLVREEGRMLILCSKYQNFIV